MGKYTCAREGMENAIKGGAEEGFDRKEMLQALIVSAVEDLKKTAGPAVVRDTLVYELDNTGGNLDTVFLYRRWRRTDRLFHRHLHGDRRGHQGPAGDA